VVAPSLRARSWACASVVPKLARKGGEGGAAAHLLDDPAGVGAHLVRGFRRRRDEDLADPIFRGAARGIEALDHLHHFLVADVDPRLDLAPQQPLPGHFRLDLPLQRPLRCADRAQIGGEVRRRPAEIAGEARIILVDLAVLDRDLVLGRRLNLQRLVDQIAHHLRA
jgi:hypothetical protein